MKLPRLALGQSRAMKAGHKVRPINPACQIVRTADDFMAFSGQLTAEASVVARSSGYASETGTRPFEAPHPQQSAS